MYRRLMSVGLVLFAIWLLGACGPKIVQVSSAENRSAVELRVGSELVLSLDSSPTGGYQWEVVDGHWGILEPQGETIYESPSPALGVPTKSVFRFRAMRPGESNLQLVYRSPREATLIPEDTFSLMVKIRP